ncbi:protein kinase family protein [Streptomyces sp. NBC_00078]|uniref:protein kinase family protein n=1 Tax=unclassified Streptomyces TaxID=2593676 RepID=UPI00225B61EC|nr:protein kinase family protein [Streptomyces sp. NBC_00078]MCX5418822.1 protein kinase family protein [Streptomyces sp. NBC_00078]
MSSATRRTTHADLATSLALLSDRELADLVESAAPLGSGIGGRSALVDVEGHRVFVKRVPLTDIELAAENAQSTGNLFGLPPACHYGTGRSPGIGAWRELAVYTMTTNWVLADRFPGFPLMHHWRVLPDSPQPPPAELADVEGVVGYWSGSRQVRERLEALRKASASLTLFLEYFPHTLHDWLDTQVRTAEADRVCTRVDEWLGALSSFLHDHELAHFDAHFQNILTDGEDFCLTDHGLALSSRFRLTRQERAFFDRHRDYDLVYSRAHLVNWLVTALYGYDRQEREAFVRACAIGARTEGIPRTAAAIIARDAPLTAVLNGFFDRLRKDGSRTPYPYEELRLAYNSSALSA